MDYKKIPDAIQSKAMIEEILQENERRNGVIFAKFNPITGEGSTGERFRCSIEGLPFAEQWLPTTMKENKFVMQLIKAGSVDKFISKHLGQEPDSASRISVNRQFVRIRCMHDFPFWCASFVKVKAKGGGEDVYFKLNYAQRKFTEVFESMRLAGKPIRIVLLKTRQWGGSTLSQIYMAWLQLIHCVGLNSLIIAHIQSTSYEIKDMFDRMLSDYPIDMLYPAGTVFNPAEPKLVGVGKSGSIYRVPQRNCKIKIGTYENPDGCRGGDYNLVHLSEVGLWQSTPGKDPSDVVGAACTGIMLKANTMIVYESTAKGSDNFFHREYIAAKKGVSQFKSVFIPWYEIEWNTLAFDSEDKRRKFCQDLFDNRFEEETQNARCESGKYLWWLWEQCGATLEGINWYIHERAGKASHEIMASECPSDDIEAFVFSGANVFDPYIVDAFKQGCREPKTIGEISADGTSGADALRNLHFVADRTGRLHIWDMPETDLDEIVTDRYLVVVDVGVGRTAKADNSVICVFDRIDISDGGVPRVVAQWVGHIDMDLLAWKAAQVSAFYNNALLVIESNSLESHAGVGAGTNHSGFILNVIKEHYDNLYSRSRSPEDIRDGIPVKYGFHTNSQTKPIVIDHLIMTLRDHAYVERDEECLAEYKSYVRTERGSFEAPSGYHDDRLMTRAIGLFISAHEMPVPRFIERARNDIHRHAPRKNRDTFLASI